jgi:uncharacterized membrane-anchored protein YitT (DUF2179 family)
MKRLLVAVFATLAFIAKAGSGGAKVIASYVVEKGKPLASPAP